MDIEIESVELYPETVNVLNKLSNKYELYLISDLASSYKEAYYKFGFEKIFKQALQYPNMKVMEWYKELTLIPKMLLRKESK